MKAPLKPTGGGTQTYKSNSAYGSQTSATMSPAVAIGSGSGYTGTVGTRVYFQPRLPCLPHRVFTYTKILRCNTSQGSQGYVTSPTSYYGSNTQPYYNATDAALPLYDTTFTSPTTGSFASYASYGSSQAYPVSNQPYNYSLQEPSYQTAPAATPATRFLDTEQRKVIIKNLVFGAKEDQISKLVRETAGQDWDKIQDINTQRDKKGNIKYVFVLFKTTGSAQRLVNNLHKKEFRGRPLDVNLAKEGATAGETTAQPVQKPSGKRSKNRNKDKDKDRSLEKDFKKVVIADGSSTRKSA